MCLYRREKCTHCGLEVSHSAIYLHYDECPELILCCPNHCSQEKMKRSKLKIHYETCPLEPLNCQFKDAGCTDKIVHRDMESHMIAQCDVTDSRSTYIHVLEAYRGVSPGPCPGPRPQKAGPILRMRIL